MGGQGWYPDPYRRYEHRYWDGWRWTNEVAHQGQRWTEPYPVPQQPQVLYVRQQKSAAVAFLLTFLFGPLGMLYSTVSGGIVMFVVSIVLAVLTLGLSLLITWPICIVWGMAACSD